MTDAHAANTQRRFETTLGVPFSAGNAITVLRNGDEIFPAMLQAIDEAQRSVEFLTFVYWTGDVATRFAEALAARATAGLRVDVLLDGYGARTMNRDVLRTMQDAGCNVRWFRPLSTWKIWQFDNRTHRKLLVCDGRVGFTGGVGIAQEWTGNAQGPDHWRDNHYRVTGPAVLGLRAGFLGNWAEAGGDVQSRMEACEYAGEPGGSAAPPTLPADGSASLPTSGDVRMQVHRSVASANWSDIAMLMRTAVTAARERLWITTAYFLPDDTLMDMLVAATERGVDVRIMIPGQHTDQRFAQLASQDTFKRLLDAGATLLVYQRTMLHRKCIVLDRHTVIIGSANVNSRSLGKDDELSCVAIDRQFNDELAADFDRDAEHCETLDVDNWKQRAAWKTWLQAVVRRVFGSEM